MKQLLPNFLFFVGFALILIQCGKMFPSANEAPKQKQKKATNLNSFLFNQQTFTTGFKLKENNLSSGFNKMFVPFFKNPALPYDVLMYINNRSILYNPYVNFTSFHFNRKNQAVLIKGK